MNTKQIFLVALPLVGLAAIAGFVGFLEWERSARDCCKDLVELEIEGARSIDSVSLNLGGRAVGLALDTSEGCVKWVAELSWDPREEPGRLSVSTLDRGRWSTTALSKPLEAAQAVRNGVSLHLRLDTANHLSLTYHP